MPSTFTEYYHGHTGLTVGTEDLLFCEQSDYQKIEIYETDTWGRLLALDGLVMLSEKDEFVYHEMLAHVPLFTHPNPQRVLIIGGGDGGAAREVMCHRTVQTVDLVEIDETVVTACKKYLHKIGDWDNPKLNLQFEDGIAFVRDVDLPYDVILIDGSDPVGPAAGLFEKGFLRSCRSALTENGVLATQSEGPWIEKYHPAIEKLFKTLDELFDIGRMYTAAIPLYPAGLWSFALASNGPDPLDESVLKRLKPRKKHFRSTLRYYNEAVHQGCFALPNFVRKIIK